MNLNALCLSRPLRETITKTLLIMKLSAIFLLAACLQVSAKGNSQNVTLSMKNAPLQKVFKEINRQTGLQFFYKDVLLRQTGRVDIDVKDAAVEEVLKQCFINLPITYAIVDKTIVVKQKENVSDGTANEPPPPIKVTGTVTNENSQPVAGASVTIKGTQKGTTTDANGYFELADVNENATLVITSVNIETIEIKLNGRTSLSITTKIKVSSIEEIQIIGYGTTTKRLNTGAVSTVKGTEIKDRPVNNVLQALQGKLPGVTITNFSPGIGSPVQLLVRGQNSITSGTNPLIIIDGVIVNENPGGLMSAGIDGQEGGANTYQQGNSPLNFINANDIESIDVLKDADATGIYGSRGTNGVILITTKKASFGKTKVSIHASTGWKSPVGVTKRMNTQQYLQMRKDAFAMGNATATSAINPITPTTQNAPDLTVWSQTAYTDYTKFEVGQPAPTYNADITMSGGTKQLNFLASGGYYRMYDTYMFRPYQERITGRIELNHISIDNKLNLHLGSIYGIENQTFTQTSFSTVQGQANVNAPNFEMYKPDGSWNFASDKGYITGQYYNPLPNGNMKNTSKTNNLLLSGDVSYSIIKGLSAKLQASYTSQNNAFHGIYPSTAVNVQNQYDQNPWGSHTTNKYTAINVEPQLNYSKTISKAKISALAGATFLEKKIEATAVKVNDPGSDDLLYNFSSGNPTTASSNSYTDKFESIFGRVNVDWDKKYIANFNFRRDGSSRFGPNNRFANFGSAGLAWIFSSESFMDNLNFLSFGKLRASYGTTGNYNIANFLYLSLLQTPPYAGYGVYNGNPGLNPSNYANPNVKWENTTKNDIGLELGFLKNRIMLSATWYRSISTDLLVSIPLSAQTGFSSYIGNFPGKVQNTGFEFDLTTQNLNPQSKFQWTTKFNITNNKNILKEYPDLDKSPYATTLEIGRALPSSNFLSSITEMPFHFTGIDPANGLPQFVDQNKDGAITWDDYDNKAAWWGSATPTTWGGMNNSLSYKGFSLDIFLQFSNGIFTKWNYYGGSIGSIFNPSTDVIGNYWMKPGDVKKYPRLYTNVPGAGAYTNPITQQYPYSTATLYKGYYVRLKNVQLNYNLPASLLSKLRFSGASIYVSGENLAVYTPEKLYKDPEIYWSRSNSLLRTITTGIRIDF